MCECRRLFSEPVFGGLSLMLEHGPSSYPAAQPKEAIPTQIVALLLGVQSLSDAAGVARDNVFARSI